MSAEDSTIRPKFILEWCQLKGSENHYQWDLIDDRNRELKTLNRKFGFVEEDQTIPVGSRTNVQPGYKRAYAEVEATFRRVYDAVPRMQDDWLRKNRVTTYEYLLLDNFVLGDSRYFTEQLVRKPNMNWLDLIRLRARSFLKHWSEETRLAGVRERVRIEKRLFPYAEMRCRKFFGIKRWPRDRTKNAEISQYRRFYFSALDEESDRLKVEMV